MTECTGHDGTGAGAEYNIEIAAYLIRWTGGDVQGSGHGEKSATGRQRRVPDADDIAAGSDRVGADGKVIDAVEGDLDMFDLSAYGLLRLKVICKSGSTIRSVGNTIKGPGKNGFCSLIFGFVAWYAYYRNKQ